MNAEEIRIEWEEDGCYLWMRMDEGDLAVRIEDPEQLYDRVKGAIGPWLRERDEAQSAYRRARREEGLRLSEHGYDISDPKHPDYHSVHADIWDAREGK